MGFRSLRRFLKPELVLILFLVLSAGYLRFKNLGYSDYIGDEFKSMIILENKQSLWNFLLTQRKGPMQFLVSCIPYLFTHDFKYELAERIPFATASLCSVVVFFFLLKKITKNTVVAFFSTFIFMVNGFIVGFGRIVQYQSLNLLFSFLAIYFYSDLLSKQKHLIRSTLIGTVFWCLSFFSHWDAIFILVPVIWLFIKFLINKELSKGYKIRVVLYNLILGLLLTLPFMIPYVLFHRTYSPSIEYFSRRISLGASSRDLYKMYIDIYNPFLTFWFLYALSLFGVLKFKKSYVYFLWFVFNFTLFELFARKPGTHIYNFLIPVFILCGYGYSAIVDFFFKTLRTKVLGSLIVSILLVPLMFLYYQTYVLFVDHSKEYPWDQKYVLRKDLGCDVGKGISKDVCDFVQKYFVLRTEKYYYEYKGQKLPLFGFPHKRYWNDINSFINEQNVLNNEKLGHATNEDPVISRGYVDVDYKPMNSYYFVGIKKPTNFVEDINPPGDPVRTQVLTIKSEDGDSIVKIFKVVTTEK